ncbi:MAG: two-component system chemotaxis sensor kinase CheA, partial [Pirellulaceae bacterium]
TFLSVDPRELLKLIRCIDTLSAFVDPVELAKTVDIDGQRVIEFIDGILQEMRGLASRLQQVELNDTLHQTARVAKSLSTHLGRPVDIEIVDDDVRVNPRTLNSLRECLIHLVRNAVDHGLEDPQERRAKQKSPRGKLVVQAERRGEYVDVSVSDDGSGIDVAAVAARAASLGCAVAYESPSDILQLLCIVGFSTRTDLTELSGRGVGLDVVASRMRSFGGTLMLDFTPGAGSRFTIRFHDAIL